MKRLISLLLVLAVALLAGASFVGCSTSDESSDEGTDGAGNTQPSGQTEQDQRKELKIGVILIGDENEGYSFAHIDGIKRPRRS